MARLLIVEDAADTLELLRFVMEEEGHETACAVSGVEGLKKAREFKSDLILLDILLPELNGYQTVKMLRADPELREIPVIILTAKSQLSTLFDRATGTQVEGYLVKPFEVSQLKEKVAEVLRKSRKLTPS